MGGVFCGVSESISPPAKNPNSSDISVDLSTLPLDFRFVVMQSALLAGIVLVPTLVVGAALSLGMLILWKRWSSWREAVVALFIVACVLASSRVGGLQYWKMLRLFFAALVFWEFLRKFKEGTVVDRRHALGFAVVVVLCTGIPALLSQHVAEGLEEAVLLSSMWTAMLVLGSPATQEETSCRLSTLVHVGLVVVAVSVAGRYAVYDLSHLNGRFRGVFGNPNEFSHWWLGLFVLGLVASNNHRNPRVLAVMMATVLFYYWSGTRGALLAALFAFGGWMLQSVRSTFFAQMTRVLLVGAGILALTAVSTDALVEFLPEQVVRRESLEAGGGRLLAWEHAVDQIKSRPWLGSGGGAEERYFRENYSYFAMQNHQGLSHNSWLAFAMNYGIPATLILFVTLLARLGLTRRNVLLVGLLPFFFSFTVEGWLTAPMSASSPMLFFVGGLLASVSQFKQDNEISRNLIQPPRPPR